LRYIYSPFSIYFIICNELPNDQLKKLGLPKSPRRFARRRGDSLDGELKKLCIPPEAADLLLRIRANAKELLEGVGHHAHNLNNLMTQFTTLDGLYGHMYSDADRQYLSEAVNRILEEVRQLYRISRADVLEGLEDRLVLFETNLNEFISESISFFRRSNPDIQVDTKIDLKHTIYINRDDMQSVMDNLLSNAKKASGGRIAIESVHQIINGDNRPDQSVTDGKYIRIKIEDNGIGIPNEIKDRLFDRFVAGDPEGTGLGLASVKKIVEAHGGYVFAESETGERSFTRFTMLLPDFELSETASKSQKRPSSMPPEPVISIGAQSEQYSQWIRAEGGKCYIADPSAGLKLIVNAPQNSVVFIEDEVELAKKIKSARPDITIVLSCDEKPSNGGSTYDSFIPKPVTEQALVQALSAFG